MPQAPTALMNLIRPTEDGDSGIWDTLLDTMFGVLDVHDHTIGKGAQVPMVGGVTIAADVPWSSGGNFYAITGIKALDFQPQATGVMGGYSGALFMNSADNELYWRSSAGALVKFTNGGNFNYSAIGAIGGDYVSSGALFDYVDVNGLYRARQELGAGVQQYAIVETGGVNLYEFKLHPTAGVPSNAVRLRSPAALAAVYTVTFPGALPAAATSRLLAIDNNGQIALAPTLPSTKAFVKIDSAGAVTTQGSDRLYSIALAQPTAAGGAAATFGAAGNEPFLSLGTSTGATYLPIDVAIGETIASWVVYLQKTSAAGTIQCDLRDHNMTTGVSSIIGVAQSNNANNPGFITLGQSGLSTVAADGHSYFIRLFGGGTTGDSAFGYKASAT